MAGKKKGIFIFTVKLTSHRDYECVELYRPMSTNLHGVVLS